MINFISTYFELGNYTQLHIYIIFFEKKKTYLIIVKSTNPQRSSKFKLGSWALNSRWDAKNKISRLSRYLISYIYIFKKYLSYFNYGCLAE